MFTPTRDRFGLGGGHPTLIVNSVASPWVWLKCLPAPPPNTNRITYVLGAPAKPGLAIDEGEREGRAAMPTQGHR